MGVSFELSLACDFRLATVAGNQSRGDAGEWRDGPCCAPRRVDPREGDAVQPALSIQISKLEDAYRAKLFERTSSGVVPTDAGPTLMRKATGKPPKM
jgi:hypothetical protein